MHQTEPRSVDTSQKTVRERIVDSAERIFAEKGFGGARIKEISQAAGVSGAMIHYYFNSKEDLHKEVLTRMVQDFVDLVSQIAPEPIPPIEKLQRFCSGLFDFAARHKNFTRITSMETGHDNSEYFLELITLHFAPLYRDAKEFLKSGMEAGIFRTFDADHLITAIYGMMMTHFSDSPFLEHLPGIPHYREVRS